MIRPMRLVALASLTLASVALAARAEDARIKVLVRADGKPVPGASVVLQQESLGFR